MAPSTTTPDGRTISLLVVTMLVTTATITGVATVPTAAREPPQPVCGVCVAFAEPQTVDGSRIDAANSTMTIRVYENGSSQWTARVRLAQGSDALRNETTRSHALGDVHRGVLEDPVARHSAVDGDTLVVSYRVPSAAHRTVGVVRFDAFHAAGAPLFAMGGEGAPYPGADRLVLVAPPAYRVQGEYGASTNDTMVVWHGDSHGQYAGHIDSDTIVSFTRRDAFFPRVRMWVAGVLDSV